MRTKALAGKITKLTPPPFFAEVEQTYFQYDIEYPLNGEEPSEVRFFHEMPKEWPYTNLTVGMPESAGNANGVASVSPGLRAPRYPGCSGKWGKP